MVISMPKLHIFTKLYNGCIIHKNMPNASETVLIALYQRAFSFSFSQHSERTVDVFHIHREYKNVLWIEVCFCLALIFQDVFEFEFLVF